MQVRWSVTSGGGGALVVHTGTQSVASAGRGRRGRCPRVVPLVCCWPVVCAVVSMAKWRSSGGPHRGGLAHVWQGLCPFHVVVRRLLTMRVTAFM
jgi:hypothetical protein